MTEINEVINCIKDSSETFVKIVSANDAGETGAHQSGIYVPKGATSFFSFTGTKGENIEKLINIYWPDSDSQVEARLVYYGHSKKEYRITRLKRKLTKGSLIIFTKANQDSYDVNTIKAEDIETFLIRLNVKNENLEKGVVVRPSIITREHQVFSLSENDGDVREKHFKPKAHILTLLGEELIKSPEMAIYELIKNSYDADAKEIDVYFRNTEDLEKAAIIIEDNGTGMTDDIVDNVWLEPGSDFRKPINSDTGLREIVRSPLFKRVPMGEKGIGRFAVHKLSRKILLISRPQIIEVNEIGEIVKSELADYEIQLYINWSDFTQSRHLTDVPVQWTIKKDPESFRFKDSSGTYIRLSGLKETWNKGMSRSLKRSTMAMLSPKNDLNKFKINLDFANNWLSDFPSTSDVLDAAPYKMVALIDKDYHLTFEYDFKLHNNDDIGNRPIHDSPNYNKSIKGQLRPFIRSYFEKKEIEEEAINIGLEKFDNSQIPFGDIMIEFYSFDLDSVSLRDTSSDPNLIKTILKDHSGIKVFKDDLRVYNYGEQGNDWLGLDLKRVNEKKWFSNNQNIGYVYLNSEQSTSLIEKTNREGFVDSSDFDLFVILIEWVLLQFREERAKDREVWLKYNKKSSSGSFENSIAKFKELIDSTDLDNKEKKTKLLFEADKIEKEFKEKQDTLILPAGVGLTASVALHEIDKLVPRMEESVKSRPFNIDQITKEVLELKDYTAGILSMLKKGGDSEIDLKKSVKQAIYNYELKLELRKIRVTVDIQDEASNLLCDNRYFITMIMNLIDNSIYWLDTVYSDSKGIYISAFRIEKSTHIIFADNGPGFSDSIEEVVKPFHSRKKGGIGLGLYIIDTLMIKYGKLNIHNSIPNSLTNRMPKEYNGAIIELIFKDI